MWPGCERFQRRLDDWLGAMPRYGADETANLDFLQDHGTRARLMAEAAILPSDGFGELDGACFDLSGYPKAVVNFPTLNYSIRDVRRAGDELKGHIAWDSPKTRLRL